MIRVMGSKDAEFEPLPMSHKIFTGMKYQLRKMPAGLGGSDASVFAMTIYDEPSIFYTANGYSKMLTVGLNADGKLDLRTDVEGNYVAVNRQFIEDAAHNFPGVTEESVAKVDQLAINMTLYMVTRWEALYFRKWK